MRWLSVVPLPFMRGSPCLRCGAAAGCAKTALAGEALENGAHGVETDRKQHAAKAATAVNGNPLQGFRIS
jgi:hypothetical protein